MTRQFQCAQKCAEINLVLEAKRIVIWAGELTQPGEPVGGIGTQNQRASRLLQLPIGVIVRARYERSGPEIFPSIQAARDNLIERLAKSPWAQIGNLAPIPYVPRPRTADEQQQRISRCG